VTEGSGLPEGMGGEQVPGGTPPGESEAPGVAPGDTDIFASGNEAASAAVAAGDHGGDVSLYFRLCVERGGSDLFLKEGHKPMARINGKVVPIHESVMDHDYAEAIWKSVLNERKQEVYNRDGETDDSHEVPGCGRFRANMFQSRGAYAMVFRHVKSDIPRMEDLNLPIDQVMKIANFRRGIVFATGITGSGKTTTLASILNWININLEKHIVTLEDPIEFVYESQKSLINQRNIGADTIDFKIALRNVVRQNPDVILIGECRDGETMEAALAAAETGHLVFTTLHTVNAIQSVERVLSFFPPHQHDLIRQQMSLTLKAIMSMRLVPKMEGFGRVPAIEILFDTPRIKELLLEGNTKAIGQAVYEGKEHYGTQTFNQALHDLYKGGLISFEDAMANADNPDELKLELRGFSSGSGGGAFQ
jgi:twitching motility protein PilT